MKYFALLAVAIVAYVDATAVLNTGASAVSRSDDGHGNYAFAYKEDHASGGTFREEKGGPGVQVGSYGLRDHDGRVRTVNYVADAHGFRANIQTNEPGVDPKEDPAAVSINGGHGGLALAGPVGLGLAAPLAVAPAVAYGGVGVGPLGLGVGPIGYGVGPASSYSVKTAHVSAPSYGYAAGPVAVGPLGLGLGYGAGLGVGKLGWK